MPFSNTMGVSDGTSLIDILKAHPSMIVRGSVVCNLFYIQPGGYTVNIVSLTFTNDN